MALRAEADHGTGFAFQRRQAGVLFSVDFSGHLLGRVWFECAQSGSTGWNGQGGVASVKLEQEAAPPTGKLQRAPSAFACQRSKSVPLAR